MHISTGTSAAWYEIPSPGAGIGATRARLIPSRRKVGGTARGTAGGDGTSITQQHGDRVSTIFCTSTNKVARPLPDVRCLNDISTDRRSIWSFRLTPPL